MLRAPQARDGAPQPIAVAAENGNIPTGVPGRPHTSVVWIDRDEDDPIFSVTAQRKKARNLARDPRISLTLIDAANPYHAVTISGTAELVDDPDKRLPVRLSQKYLGEDPPSEPAEARRLVIRVTAGKITTFAGWLEGRLPVRGTSLLPRDRVPRTGVP